MYGLVAWLKVIPLAGIGVLLCFDKLKVLYAANVVIVVLAIYYSAAAFMVWHSPSGGIFLVLLGLGFSASYTLKVYTLERYLASDGLDAPYHLLPPQPHAQHRMKDGDEMEMTA